MPPGADTAEPVAGVAHGREMMGTVRALDLIGGPAGRTPSPRGVVLLLHGGAEASTRPVTLRSGAWNRARVLGRSIAPSLGRADVATYGLRYNVRGWNAPPGEPSPLADARWALERIHARHPDAPIVLLGHSMGARTGLWVADDPAVIAVIGLAPWWPADDPVDALPGRHVVGIHGARDRITSPRHTRKLLHRAEAVAASTQYVEMGPVGHYMLTHVREWNRAALRHTLTALTK